ncbi:hypothetical protein [Cytobacillus purgationiresistens]|uniref:Magnesium-transporting ATPase (P-type) n=1 Tax=Cytobacillus purgationiresistens TaxID=863449 RepID=A0ABU0AEW9_9BACI|nr:hypothetical protein [Cytobacillus purgationiresistens]MDQ0269798.1 magnesium-transporting ATPase (P-type) [Cytobacillus purgationiresistens]
MNKSDFRVQMPLWNIVLCMILLIWFYGIVHYVDLMFDDFEGVFSIVENEVVVQWPVPATISIIIGVILIIVFFIAYSIKIKQHNKLNPSHRVNGVTLINPGELIDDDEMLRQVTQNATKKVYVFFTSVLPLLVFLFAFPFNRYVFIVLILLIMVIHNLLLYLEINKYLDGSYNSHQPISNEEKKQKRLKMNRTLKMIISSIVIIAITFAVIRLIQINSNHKSIMIKAEQCMDEGKVVVMENDGFFSLTKFSCINNE